MAPGRRALTNTPPVLVSSGILVVLVLLKPPALPRGAGARDRVFHRQNQSSALRTHSTFSSGANQRSRLAGACHPGACIGFHRPEPSRRAHDDQSSCSTSFVRQSNHAITKADGVRITKLQIKNSRIPGYAILTPSGRRMKETQDVVCRVCRRRSDFKPARSQYWPRVKRKWF